MNDVINVYMLLCQVPICPLPLSLPLLSPHLLQVATSVTLDLTKETQLMQKPFMSELSLLIHPKVLSFFVVYMYV